MRMMSGIGRDFIDVNGTSGSIEEIHSLQGETISLFSCDLVIGVVMGQSFYRCKRKSAYAKQFMR